MKKGIKHSGFTLIELIITIVILAILASVAMPLLQVTSQRNKEIELRDNLQKIRIAIDAYKKAYDEGLLGLKSADKTGYPPNLEVLVEGVESSDPSIKHKLKFLRKIPKDPMLKNDNLTDSLSEDLWGLRSYDSSPESPTSGDDVYDIYSLSPLTGTNGVPYAQW
jgi:general secretion pathway protein G